MGVYLENSFTPHVPTPLNVADAMYLRDRPDLSQEQNVVEGQEESMKESGDAVKFIIAQQGAFRSLFFPGGVVNSNEDWNATQSGSDIVLHAVGDWIGNVIMLEQGGNLSFESLPDVNNDYEIRFPMSSKRALFYTMEGGSPVSLTVNAPDKTFAEDFVWESIASWEVPESTTVNISAWAKETPLFYDVQFRWLVNGVQFGAESARMKSSSYNSWLRFDFPSSHIPAGSTITLQAWGRSTLDERNLTLSQIHLDVSYISHT